MQNPHAADLQAFQALIASPIRHELREQVLADWQHYKIGRQLALGIGAGQGGKQGTWTQHCSVKYRSH